MSQDYPTLSDVIRAALDGALDGVRTGLPGVILAYDANQRRATVQVVVSDGVLNEEGARIVTPIPAMSDVPVLGIGSGTLRVKIPIRPGDPCWLMFSSSCLAQLKATGRLTVQDPGDDRRHHEADVVAMPVPSYAASLADDDAMIEFTDAGEIHAGGSQSLATKADVASLANFVQGLLVGGTGSAPIPPGTVPQPTGTTKLKGG